MQGVFTALVTPFLSDDSLDLSSYRRLLKHQKQGKVAGVVPCGSTGESLALSLDEKKALIVTALKEQEEGFQVIPGTLCPRFQETLELSRWAGKEGAKAILIATPYYQKPSQAGLVEFFLKIADQIECDLILYQIPGRSGVSLQPETVAKLALHPNIKGLKDSSGDLSYFAQVRQALSEKNATLEVFSGDDPYFLPHLLLGAKGVISVASHVAPKAIVELYHLGQNSEIEKARLLHDRLFPLFRDLFIETNPVPVKFALSKMNLCSAQVRSPLTSLTQENERQLSETLQSSPLSCYIET